MTLPKVQRSCFPVWHLTKKKQKTKQPTQLISMWFAESWGCFQTKCTFRYIQCRPSSVELQSCFCGFQMSVERSPCWACRKIFFSFFFFCSIFVVNLKHCFRRIPVWSPFCCPFCILCVWQGPYLGLATFFAFHSNRHERPALPCKWDDITYRESSPAGPPPPPLPCSANPKDGHHASDKPHAF